MEEPGQSTSRWQPCQHGRSETTVASLQECILSFHAMAALERPASVGRSPYWPAACLGAIKFHVSMNQKKGVARYEPHISRDASSRKPPR